MAIARKCYSTLIYICKSWANLHFSSLLEETFSLTSPHLSLLCSILCFQLPLGHNKVVMHDSLWSRIGVWACCVATKWAHSLWPGSVTGPGQWDKDNVAGTFPNWWKQKDSNHSESWTPLSRTSWWTGQLSELSSLSLLTAEWGLKAQTG